MIPLIMMDVLLISRRNPVQAWRKEEGLDFETGGISAICIRRDTAQARLTLCQHLQYASRFSTKRNLALFFLPRSYDGCNQHHHSSSFLSYIELPWLRELPNEGHITVIYHATAFFVESVCISWPMLLFPTRALQLGNKLLGYLPQRSFSEFPEPGTVSSNGLRTNGPLSSTRSAQDHGPDGAAWWWAACGIGGGIDLTLGEISGRNTR